MGMSEGPPRVAYFVVEVDISHDRDEPLFAALWGPFHSRERAERERESWEESWEQALEEWDGECPYDFKGWDIVEKHLGDRTLDSLERQSEESHRITMEAVNAVGASLLAEEGIGPFAESDHD